MRRTFRKASVSVLALFALFAAVAIAPGSASASSITIASSADWLAADTPPADFIAPLMDTNAIGIAASPVSDQPTGCVATAIDSQVGLMACDQNNANDVGSGSSDPVVSSLPDVSLVLLPASGGSGPSALLSYASADTTSFSVIGLDTGSTAAVPEPVSLVLFGTGLMSLVALRRRAQAKTTKKKTISPA